MSCWSIWERLQIICGRICSTWTTSVGGRGGASGGLPFFLCSALLGPHLFPSTAPSLPLPLPPSHPPCACEVLPGLQGGLAEPGPLTLALTQPGLPPSGRLSIRTFYCPIHPACGGHPLCQRQGPSGTGALRVPECRTAAARARARATALVHPGQLTFP